MKEKKASMVDVTLKPVVLREAEASGRIKLRRATVQLIKMKGVEKGDPLEVARLAGVMAAKNTSQLIPLCHPLPLSHVEVDIKVVGEDTVEVSTKVRAEAKTGVEMEALTGTAVALLTVWDMVKRYEKDGGGQYPETEITHIRVNRKVKGQS